MKFQLSASLANWPVRPRYPLARSTFRSTSTIRPIASQAPPGIRGNGRGHRAQFRSARRPCNEDSNCGGIRRVIAARRLGQGTDFRRQAQRSGHPCRRPDTTQIHCPTCRRCPVDLAPSARPHACAYAACGSEPARRGAIPGEARTVG